MKYKVRAPKVCFVSPPRTSPVGVDGCPVQKLRTNMCLPACTVLGSLSSHGFEVCFLDAAADYSTREYTVGESLISYGMPQDDIIDWLFQERPDYVLITSMFTFEQFIVDDLVRTIKAKLPEVLIILGGIHASIKPEWHLEECAPDFIVVGEGELTIVELLQELEKTTGDPARVSGICFRDTQGRIVQTVGRALLESLDLPWCFDEVLYRRDGSPRYLDHLTRKSPVYQKESNGVHVRSAALYGSRGCPFSCLYCASTPRDGGRIRHRGGLRMFEDFLLLRQTYGVSAFYNQADTFGFHQEDLMFLKELSRYRAETGDTDFVINNPNAFFVRTFFEGTAPKLRADFIDCLARAGINVVTLAVETFSQRFNRKVDWKRITLGHLADLCFELRRNGIKIDLYMMYGFPGQDKSEFLHDIEAVEWLSPSVDWINWHFCTLLPGTTYFNSAVAMREIDEGYYRAAVRKGYNFFFPRDDFNLSNVSTEFLVNTVSRYGRAWT